MLDNYVRDMKKKTIVMLLLLTDMNSVTKQDSNKKIKLQHFNNSIIELAPCHVSLVLVINFN